MLYKTLLIILCVVLVGCSPIGGGNENQYKNLESQKYFTGREGITAHFQNMPQRLYYYGPNDNSFNEFSFGVELHNKGASFSRGGIYVSGFDPNLLVFREIPIAGTSRGDCGISVGTLGFGTFGGIFSCNGVSIESDFKDLYRFEIDSDLWDNSRFDFDLLAERNPTGDHFVVNFNSVDLEYFQLGRLFIALFSPLNFRKNAGQEFFLAGDNYHYPGGEYSYFVYNGRIVDWPPGLDETEQNFLLTTCYLYTTYADPIVCVDPEPYSEHRKVCRPQSRSYSGGNGAPVAITSIEQENTPRKIIFHINVKNVGTGTVWDAGRMEKCSPYYPGRAFAGDLNVVYLGDVRVGTTGLNFRGGKGGIECSPEVIRLDPRTGTGSTTCSYPIEFAQIKSAYQTPLVVELWYGYSDTYQQNIRIKQVI